MTRSPSALGRFRISGTGCPDPKADCAGSFITNGRLGFRLHLCSTGRAPAKRPLIIRLERSTFPLALADHAFASWHDRIGRSKPLMPPRCFQPVTHAVRGIEPPNAILLLVRASRSGTNTLRNSKSQLRASIPSPAPSAPPARPSPQKTSGLGAARSSDSGGR